MMQQTEKYKLNLIEPSDPFLPDGLNANTQRVEEVLQAHMEAPIAALDQRLSALEARKLVYGAYSPGPDPTKWHFVPLPFTPLVVAACELRDSSPNCAIAIAPDINNMFLRIAEGGFEVYGVGDFGLNKKETAYIALG